MSKVTEIEAPKASVESADDLIESRPLRVETRYVEFFDRDMHFRELTANGIDMFLGLKIDEKQNTATFGRDNMLNVLQKTICNAYGELLFNSDEGREQLGELPWKGFEELFLHANECIGVTAENVEAKKKR